MSDSNAEFTIHFWGVRGSIPCPGSETVRYGGNTSCIEMRVNGERLIFDGGTGLRELGQQLLGETAPVRANMFFTHSHWDHIQGFPFFVPAFLPQNKFYVYGVVAPNGSTIEQRLNDQMLHPNFPVPLQIMQAQLQFCDLEVGETVRIGNVKVHNGLLNHPGEAVGYRVEYKDFAVAYITDTEHFPDALDENVLALAKNADVMIYDCTYTDDEYYAENNSKVGWGHSTWQEGVKMAKAAGVKQLVVFHHDPLHNDDFMDEIGRQTAAAFHNSIVAREGMMLDVTAVKSLEALTHK